jgi:cytochrome c-type biogenesis protein CcmH
MHNSHTRPRPGRLLVVLGWLLALCATALPALANDAAPAAADPALEARMTRITAELRCLVCQNQTIADSNADLAVDLRRQVREMLSKGDDDAKIIQYMTDRYGDFVLYRPPVKATTMLLWFGPALMLLFGFGALAVVMRRRARAAANQFEPDDPALFADPHQS